MYHITLKCEGIATEVGTQVASDVAEEFTHRPWQNVLSCDWDGSTLTLIGENDYDRDGNALADEFSDAIGASYGGVYAVRIDSVLSVVGD